MGAQINHKTFIERLLIKNESFKRGEFKIKSIYKNALSKIDVETKYGSCQVEANSLLKGYTPTISSAVNKTEYFIRKAFEVHGDRYDYSKVVYVGAYDKIQVCCKIHGDFMVTPKEHLKSNCSKCANIHNSFNWESWSKVNPEKPGIIYLLKCYNEKEVFLKLGITSLSIKKRYIGKLRMPYKYEVIFQLSYPNKKSIWDLENDIKNTTDRVYNPLIPFKGSVSECFPIEAQEDILNKLKSFENFQIEQWLKISI